ncbi:Uncharacterised protein [Mycobacteroides abscessus subsp. abscessus]|nr:Uncharacterised protein [Mycobacteroides abscessus subsp. abscessus]
MVAVEVGRQEGGHARSLVNRTVLLLTPMTGLPARSICG